jgi:hypothetical protein
MAKGSTKMLVYTTFWNQAGLAEENSLKTAWSLAKVHMVVTGALLQRQ